MNNTPTPEQVDAVLAEWDIPTNQSEVDKLREYGKILVEANTRHFEAAQVAHKENVRLQADLLDSRARHRKLLRAIKAILGHKNWPDIEGDFLDGVVALLKEHCDRLQTRYEEASQAP